MVAYTYCSLALLNAICMRHNVSNYDNANVIKLQALAVKGRMALQFCIHFAQSTWNLPRHVVPVQRFGGLLRCAARRYRNSPALVPQAPLP